jgi:small-conductance mechanosensitive channel
MKQLLIALVGVYLAVCASAQEVSNTTSVVMFHGEELFELASISSVSAEIRSEGLVRQLKRIARSPLVNTDDLVVHDDDSLSISVIMAGPNIVLAVLEADAAFHGTEREKLAEEWAEKIRGIVDQYRRDRTTESYVRGTLFSVAATLVLLLISFIIRKICRKETAWVEKGFAGQQMLKFLDGDSIVAINHTVIKIVRVLLMLWVLVIYLNLVLSFFPWTFNLSAKLFELISTPVAGFALAFVDNLPKLFTLAVIIAITHFILKGLKHVFDQIGEGKVRIKGFYQDWADTTFALVRTVIIVFAAVVAWPSIPGSDSAAFKGISIFMGVLVSLGSTSTVGNIFGGLMLTYMRSFQPGDFVEINGLRGTVMSSRTFSTRLKTPTNEIISIPNAAVSANPIINFSRMTKSIGVIIGTSVTIGYDVPWRKVHELLLKSAEGVDDVLDDPSPVILQLSLDDFYVKYKLVVSTKEPAKQFRILSNIHQNIQDNFAAAGVEIMSPHYQSNRTGEQPALPGLDSDLNASA